jgi:beta-lactamase class D
VTSGGHPYAELQRALKNGNVWVAEAVARELPKVSLEDALKLVHLYAEKQSPKFEKAAVRWLPRYLNEASPELSDVAKVVAELVPCGDPSYS